MNIRTFANAAAVVALGLSAWTTLKAQGPLYDRVDVNLPYTVTIGDRTLQPGNYVIQQLRSTSGDSRVLLIYSDNGMKFETSAMTIPALDINTARDTKVILHHLGNDYYFDKIWIQGKDYGYEFPLPDSVKGREKEQMQPVSVAANYSSVPSTNTETTTASKLLLRQLPPLPRTKLRPRNRRLRNRRLRSPRPLSPRLLRQPLWLKVHLQLPRSKTPRTGLRPNRPPLLRPCPTLPQGG